MIHDGFIYLATLMLLAAILVNLPVYLRGKGAQTFFKFAPPIVLIYLGMMLFMYYESMGSAGYVSHLRIDQKSVTLRNAVFNAAAL